MSICPTCDAQVPDYPFAVGDRVQHMSGKEGTVERMGQSMTVLFEDNSRGIYDRLWFRVHPVNALVKI